MLVPEILLPEVRLKPGAELPPAIAPFEAKAPSPPDAVLLCPVSIVPLEFVALPGGSPSPVFLEPGCAPAAGSEGSVEMTETGGLALTALPAILAAPPPPLPTDAPLEPAPSPDA
jgi:hypothetical protein